jgi:Na+-transporting methylmalonyl-CoA/oxaloacetate decarboxylase gamma subunit
MQRNDVPNKTLVLLVLAFLLFITLILWMVGNIRNEGFKGKRKSVPVKSQNKTNLSPTLLGVLPVLALALFATIGHVVYKSS